jgi:hypothetical protein
MIATNARYLCLTAQSDAKRISAMVLSDNHPKGPNLSGVTARLFEIILDMPY